MKVVGKPLSVVNRLRELSATNRIEEMEKNLENDVHIIPEMALSGQITLFYARPGTGKTLLFFHFILSVIREGIINSEDLFYINADDNYKGILTKSRIAEENGFHMISPAEAEISPGEIISILIELSQTDEAKGKIVFLDTLKKFTDMMNKRSQAALYNVLRQLVAKNATVIIAGHSNKHPDFDGNLVYEGTSDTMNDVDCVFSIYRMTESDTTDQVVEFRREKDRGDVINRVSYGYRKAPGMSYRDIVNSVYRLDDDKALHAIECMNEGQLKKQYESEMLFVTELLQAKYQLNQSQILKAFTEKASPLTSEISVRTLKTALKKLSGVVWAVSRGDRNAKVYQLIGADQDQISDSFEL